MAVKSSVLFPLYIYPFEGAWDPLYQAASKYPHLKFTVVVNPFNGPGDTALPDANYLREIPKLNSLQNVRTVGYIRLDYARRDLQEVLDDVTQYSQWAKEGEEARFAMHGVFIDEVPNAYTDEVKEYLDTLAQHVKSVEGIAGDRFLIHNPGSVPDVRYTEPGPDLTVVTEDVCAKFESDLVQELLDTCPYSRERCCIVVHSAPADRIGEVVQRVRQRAGHVFVTDLATNFYESFGPTWTQFIDLLQFD